MFLEYRVWTVVIDDLCQKKQILSLLHFYITVIHRYIKMKYYSYKNIQNQYYAHYYYLPNAHLIYLHLYSYIHLIEVLIII